MKTSRQAHPGLNQQGRFFLTAGLSAFFKPIGGWRTSAISCCKRLPSIGSVTHLITRGGEKKGDTAPPNRTFNKLAMNGIESCQCPSLPFLSVEGLGSIIIFILLSLPFQRIFNIQPTLQKQLMLYPCVP